MKQFVFFVVAFLSSVLPVWSQTIDYAGAKFMVADSSNHEEIRTQVRCRITNTTDGPLVLLLTEDDINSVDKEIAIKRKMFRNYGDFRLSMLAWEPNLLIEEHLSLVPQLFVKVLTKDDQFDLFLESKDIDAEMLKTTITNHLIIADEKVLSADKVGLSHFVEGVFEHNYNFPYDFIMIDFNYFQDFISKKGLIK